jgi:hypothetical protein
MRYARPSAAAWPSRWWRLLPLIALVVAGGCSARVSGFSSPVAHDYAAVSWRPLAAAVQQPFVAGPGYAAALHDDPTTTPAELQRRMAALPRDAREGELDELRLGLRLAGEARDAAGAWDTGARVRLQLVPGLDARYPEPADYHAWPESDRWLPRVERGLVARQSFVSAYPMLEGLNLRVATFGGDLSAGEGTVGPAAVAVLSLPDAGQQLATLPPGARVPVLGAAEGWAQVGLADGRAGFVAFDAFASLPPPADPLTRSLRFELEDASGAVVRVVDIPPGMIHDNSHLGVRFDPIERSAGVSYTFSLTLSDAGSGGMTVRVTPDDRYADGARYIATGPTGDDLVFKPYHGAIPPLLDIGIDQLERHGDWVVLTDLPPVEPGLAIGLWVVPGTGTDAGELEYGITPGRVPYGGWQSIDATGNQLDGALLLQTRYERDVALWSVAGSAWSQLRAGVREDRSFMLFWLAGLAGVGVAALRLRRPRQVRGA